MKKQGIKILGIFFLSLMLFIAGCDTTDDSSVSSTITGSADPDEMSRFWVGSGISSYFGVYISDGLLVLNVPPQEKTYKLRYRTGLGIFYVVFKSTADARLFIGLTPNDNVIEAVIEEGDLTTVATTSPDIQYFGSLTVFYRPGFLGSWSDFIVVNQSVSPIILIQNKVVVESSYVLILTEPGKTRKTKLTKKTKKLL